MKLPKRPVIETERLVLRLVEKGDLPALFAVNGDRKVFRYSPRAHWKTPADGKAWFSRIMTHRKNGATIQFVIVLRESGLPIGTFAAFNFDESVGSAEIGYVLGREHWGKGLIKEALAEFIHFAFETLKLKRLEAELDPRNLASAKALERVGFTREGCRRSNYFSKGEITDTGLYGMLAEDPRPGLNERRPQAGGTAGSRRRTRVAEQPSFDAAKYKSAQREQWNKDGAAWRRWNPTLDRWYGEVTRRMLDLARLRTGQRVLDVAAGAGEPTVSAAEQIGPSGYVLATDISEGIVALALQVARERGLKQVEARAMDGEKLDLPDASFDAVLCRLGLMYMPNPVTALREWRRVLKAGGRVAVVVFSTPERNSWGAMPAAVIRRRAGLPPPAPGQPGPFSLGGPGVLEGIFRQAGFVDPEIRAVAVPLRTASAAEYVQVAREAFGAFNAMMSHLSPQERESAWTEVEDSMRRFESPDGFEAPGECLVGAATK